MSDKLNLYQKLVEVRKSVAYLKKDVKGFQYNYTKESAVIGALRPALDEYAVLIDYQMLKPETKDGVVEIGFEFTIINAENPVEQIIKRLYLQDQSADPKKIGGLMTYALRYFLLKTFLIATDEMDLDAYQEKTLATKSVPKPMASDEDITTIAERIKDHPDIKETLLKQLPGKRLENITADKVEAINSWLDKRLNKDSQ